MDTLICFFFEIYSLKCYQVSDAVVTIPHLEMTISEYSMLTQFPTGITNHLIKLVTFNFRVFNPNHNIDTVDHREMGKKPI